MALKRHLFQQMQTDRQTDPKTVTYDLVRKETPIKRAHTIDNFSTITKYSSWLLMDGHNERPQTFLLQSI